MNFQVTGPSTSKPKKKKTMGTSKPKKPKTSTSRNQSNQETKATTSQIQIGDNKTKTQLDTPKSDLMLIKELRKELGNMTRSLRFAQTMETKMRFHQAKGLRQTAGQQYAKAQQLFHQLTAEGQSSLNADILHSLNTGECLPKSGKQSIQYVSSEIKGYQEQIKCYQAEIQRLIKCNLHAFNPSSLYDLSSSSSSTNSSSSLNSSSSSSSSTLTPVSESGFTFDSARACLAKCKLLFESGSQTLANQTIIRIQDIRQLEQNIMVTKMDLFKHMQSIQNQQFHVEHQIQVLDTTLHLIEQNLNQTSAEYQQLCAEKKAWDKEYGTDLSKPNALTQCRREHLDLIDSLRQQLERLKTNHQITMTQKQFHINQQQECVKVCQSLTEAKTQLIQLWNQCQTATCQLATGKLPTGLDGSERTIGTAGDLANSSDLDVFKPKIREDGSLLQSDTRP